MQDPGEWRLTSPGGIKHKLIRQWGRFGREDSSWNQEICIQSHDLLAFIVECFPAPVVDGNFVIYDRRFYPAGLSALECKDITVEGFTSGRPIDPFAAGVALYTAEEYVKTFEPYLRVTITYGPSPTNDRQRDPDNPFTFLEISASAAGEFLTSEVNQDDVNWEDEDGETEQPNDTDTELNQTVTSLEVEWTCKWPQIPFAFFYDVLKPRMHSVMGRVNNAPLALFGDAPAETILFLGYQKDHEYTWRDGYTGSSPVGVTMRFVEKNFMGRQKLIEQESESSASASSDRPTGPGIWQDVQVTHNHMWRPNHGWQRLLVDGQPIYALSNLMTIFTG